MKSIAKLSLVALAGTGALALMATSASARVVCNGEGACWHTRVNYNYRPEFGLTVHPDTWRWGAGEHFTWREHPGRGYWHSGSWHKF